MSHKRDKERHYGCRAALHSQTGQRVVVLIDAYDKPMVIGVEFSKQTRSVIGFEVCGPAA